MPDTKNALLIVGFLLYYNKTMTPITIPKKITKGEELIIIPRKEYEEFSHWRKLMSSFKTFKPTPTQKRDLKKAREDFQQKRFITLNELKRKLEIKN